MKEISRRFEAHEFWDPDNSRFELRLLVQPVHRYSDESQSLIDGAIFVLAHDTNPEILVQLEAHADINSDGRWKVSFSRLGSAELHVLTPFLHVIAVFFWSESGFLVIPGLLFRQKRGRSSKLTGGCHKRRANCPTGN
jgi:hypothetical protein